MAMDATLQVRMDHDLKVQVEELYRSLGTSFAEAVRIFAQQSLREGGMPFRPTLKTWDELTAEEIQAAEKLISSLDPHPGQAFQAAEPTYLPGGSAPRMNWMPGFKRG